MNLTLIIPEIAVIGLAMAVLLLDLWTPVAHKARLGYVVVAGLAVIFCMTLTESIGADSVTGFAGVYDCDGLVVFFRRFFIVAAMLVVLLGIEFSDRIPLGIAEFYVLVLLALTGMMFSSAINDFTLMFVALELITVTFYVLVSFQRRRLTCLEAGVKYLVMGALSTGFLIFGIALLFAASNTTNFAALSAASVSLGNDKLFWLGLLLLLVGVSFKIAAVPMQMWAPDVYQGAPTPVTAFLAVASKAAGFVILLRVLFIAVPYISRQWETFFMILAGATILYGNLCAIPQRNLKRLLGYSSIAQAGYLLLGIAALSHDGTAAILYYLLGYLFTLGAVFVVLCLIGRDSEDISSLAGLNRRSPILAAAMAMGMVSLSGIPPLAGFAGKFLLIRAVVEQAPANPAYYWLAFVAVAGVIISLYYYFGVIRAMYWPDSSSDRTPVMISPVMKLSLAICMVGMLYLGLFPNSVIVAAEQAVSALKF